MCARLCVCVYTRLRVCVCVWRCETEQVVRTGEGAFHRADLIATAPDGTLWALDVSITATPGSSDTVHAHLERTATAKAFRYTPGGARHPDGHTLVPLIHSADYGWLSLEGLSFLQRLLTYIAASEPPLGIDAWKSHVASVTSYHLATLASTMHLAHWQMHQACGRLL